MDKFQNTKMIMSFDKQILSIKFVENEDIELSDIQTIYDFGNEKSKGQPYCILFDSSSDYDISEDAIEYISDNPNNKHILAKAYITNTKISKIRARLHIKFDNPTVQPNFFESETEALTWLQSFLVKK